MIDVNIFKCKKCGSRNTYVTKHYIVCRRCGNRMEMVNEVKKDMVEGLGIKEEEVVEEGIEDKEIEEDVAEEIKEEEGEE